MKTEVGGRGGGVEKGDAKDGRRVAASETRSTSVTHVLEPNRASTMAKEQLLCNYHVCPAG